MKRHLWTKDEIRKIVSLWDTKTIEEISDMLDVKRTTLLGIACRMRKIGFKLTKKNKSGYIENLLKEVLKEKK